MQQFIVDDRESGRRVDQYIYKLLPNATSSFVYKMLRKKNITVNRKKVEGNERLSYGDSIEMFFSDDTYEKMSGKSQKDGHTTETVSSTDYIEAYKQLTGIEIVYEDDDFIFVDKPAGVLSQKALPTDVSLNEWLVGYMLDKGELTPELIATFRPGFANRLDRNTTGLVLGGKSLPALRVLSNMIKERTLQKFYLAEAMGEPDSLLPVIRDEFVDSYAYLIKDKKNNQVSIYDSEEEAAKYKKGNSKIEQIHTGFRLIEQNRLIQTEGVKGNTMLLEIDLHTGKSHQIRAHLAHLGHPIVGDPKYGDGKGTFQELKAYRVVFPELDEYPKVSGKEFTC